MADFMDVMKRSNIRNSTTTAEIITSYEWDFQFTKVPGLWGNVGDAAVSKFLDLYRCRTDSVAVPEEPQQTPVVVGIRGHQFSQPGLSANYGQFSFVLQDFADTGIQKNLLQLQYAMSMPETKEMKSNSNDFFFDCNFYQLNSERQLIKKWVCKDCLLLLANVTDTMNSTKSAVGQISVAFSTDFYTIEYPTSPSSDIGTPTYFYGSQSIGNSAS